MYHLHNNTRTSVLSPLSFGTKQHNMSAAAPSQRKAEAVQKSWVTNFLMGGVAASISKTAAAPIVSSPAPPIVDVS